MNDYAWNEAKKGIFGSCLLGTSHILMANYSFKQIKDIQTGDLILDGNLKLVKVIATTLQYLLSEQDVINEQGGRIFSFST